MRVTEIGDDDLAFASELIRVRDEHTEWEGVAERLLRGFGLSLLVADEHYPAVLRRPVRSAPRGTRVTRISLLTAAAGRFGRIALPATVLLTPRAWVYEYVSVGRDDEMCPTELH